MMGFNKLIHEAGEGRPVKIHSALVEPGDIFVALSGTKAHGAGFIPEALERGASWVLSGFGESDKYPGKRIIGHEDPSLALGELARAFYHTDGMKLVIIGITGTNGKTTTSYLLEHIFTCCGFKTGVIGTVNHRWPGRIIDASMTTPDCLRLHEMLSCMDREGVEMVIMEVSSHALAQNRVAGIDFNAGIFTNLSQDHLDYHEDMTRYFQAKSKLFLNPERKSHFRAVVNADDEYGRILLNSIPKALSYGMKDPERAGLWGRLTKNDRTGISLECRHKDQQWQVNSSLSGGYNGYNLLAAQGAALSIGLGPQHFTCLESFGQTPGRLEKVPNQLNLDIFVDYAHTPDALKNVCFSLGSLDFDRLIVLFGCGGNRDKSKRPLMARAAAEFADVIFLTSDNPRDEDPMLIIEEMKPGLNGCKEIYIQPDRRKAIEAAIMFMKPGDALLVAGKGHEVYQEIRGVRRPFSDAEEIRKAVSQAELSGHFDIQGLNR